MFEALIWLTAILCVGALAVGYMKYRDVFHPLIAIPPMCAFIYVYMPLRFMKTGELFTFVSEERLIFVQTMVVLTLGAFFLGCINGSSSTASETGSAISYANPAVLQKGAMILGGLGLLAWGYTIKNSGGFTGAFGQAYGAGWSDFGYIREAVYLLIVALLLLISPPVIKLRDKKWYCAVVVLSMPWFMQAFLGARRGPTFVIIVTLALSWFMARGKRPPLLAMAGSGAALGFLMLFLVTNRSHIYLGSNFKGLTTDVSEVAEGATAANEYIFGAGCMVATRYTDHYYWGRRYLAEVLVRPIPRQIWPNKYEDVGLGDLEQNAGVAGSGLQTILGWAEVPGAAAAMVADLWVEFSWLEVPFAFLIGWAYGRTWRKALVDGGFWTTQYTVLMLLSIYLVTQSGEAVIFRLALLSVPTAFVWRKANQSPVYLPAFR